MAEIFSITQSLDDSIKHFFILSPDF